MNTRIEYEYRDGANYRFYGSIVVAGEMTDELWRRLRAACDPDTEGFIAHQVSFPEVFGYVPGDHVGDPEYEATGYPFNSTSDHCWHTLSGGSEAWELTDETVTDCRSVIDVVKAFEAARTAGWQVFDPQRRFQM